jgi:predicted site-specific integrase-resolvase
MARISYDDQKERLRRAVQHAEHTARTQTRTNWLDLLVLR